MLRAFLLIAAIITLVALSQFVDVQGRLTDALDWIAGQGLAGAIVFIFLYIAAAVLLIPGSILTLGAGAVYGLAWGLPLVSVSSTLAATAAFLVGRYIARDWVAAKLSGNARFAAIDDAVGDEGWKIVALTRLSPVFPYTLLNYAYSLTKVRLSHYFFASWAGMLPGTAVYVYVGTITGDLATLGATDTARTPAQWALLILGLAATIVVTWYITRLARRALARHTPQSESA